jgi:hypothetical protein
LKRAIILLHRYLGIALCLMVAAWCVSGAVMMYVAFPSFTNQQRVANLEPLAMDGCCRFDAVRRTLRDVLINHFEIEMLTGRPMLRLANKKNAWIIDLREGAILRSVDNAMALQIAIAYERRVGLTSTPLVLGTIDHDQWTVSGGYAKYGPLYKVALNDVEGTELYIGASGAQIVQRTTARERGWNYLGAVTHWLYFTPLRQHAVVWTQTVIWLSVLGVLLTIAGIYLGFAQLRVRENVKQWSSYRGLKYWHHIFGVLFGLLVLGWIGSGFLSMNPWGLLESSYGADEAARLNHVEMTATQAIDITERLVQNNRLQHLLGDQKTLQVSSDPLGNSLFLIATGVGTNAEYRRFRLDPFTLEPAPLYLPEVLRAIKQLHSSVVVSTELLNAADNYYYSDHERDVVPAYRIVLNDAENSSYYFDSVSGQLLSKVDRAARSYRWLFNAVHRWDFSADLRRRPLWDFVVVTLLLGVAACSLTGVVLAFRRIT